MADSTRSQKQKSLIKDVKHLLEELWEAEKEDALCKIFTKETKMGMQKYPALLQRRSQGSAYR